MTEIFVFGSNLNGFHGAGSARFAMDNHGAKYGCGVGIQGKSYAIPTLDKEMNVISIEGIKKYVNDFLSIAKINPHLIFNIVAIGCGIAGYTPEQIAPLFNGYTENCKFIGGWNEIQHN